VRAGSGVWNRPGENSGAGWPRSSSSRALN